MSDAQEARPCRACGMEIEFYLGPGGRYLPLQRVRNVYVKRDPLQGGSIEALDRPADAEALFVSHFETCPQANRFSGKKEGRR